MGDLILMDICAAVPCWHGHLACVEHLIILFVSKVKMAHLEHVFSLSWSSFLPIDNWVCILENHLSECNVVRPVMQRGLV